jgi:hypothetical protein
MTTACETETTSLQCQVPVQNKIKTRHKHGNSHNICIRHLHRESPHTELQFANVIFDSQESRDTVVDAKFDHDPLPYVMHFTSISAWSDNFKSNRAEQASCHMSKQESDQSRHEGCASTVGARN